MDPSTLRPRFRLINAQPEHTAAFWVTARPRRGDWRATIAVKAAYRLVPGGPAIPDEAKPPSASGDDPSGPAVAARYASDFVPFKPKADFIVVGDAYAPDGKPVERCRVSVAIGEHRKSLVAIGDRAWAMGPLGASPGQPKPFVTLPIGYDRAFGGPGNRRNPLGCGHDMRAQRALPNIERLDQLITQTINSPDPAGFGPIDMMWHPRVGRVGSFDGGWLKERWPWFPTDFNWSFFNAAPEDQQFPFFRGDETLAFENLHPEHTLYRSSLPGVCARVLVERPQQDGETFEEVPVKLDTVWVDLPAERLVLVWRGVTRVASPRLTGITTICCTLEPLDTQIAFSTLRDAFIARKAAATTLPDAGDALERAKADKLRAEAKAQIAEVQAMAENLRKVAETMRSATGLDARRGRPAGSFNDPMAALEQGIAALRARDPARAQQLEEQLAAADRQLGEIPSAAGSKWTRAKVMEALATGIPLAKAKLDGLDLAKLDFAGIDLTDATLLATNLTQARLDRAKLTGADLGKSLLLDASFVKADLSQAIFTEAKADGATFAGARIDGTNFSGLDLTGVDFSGTVGTAPDFSETILDSAYFARATLPRANFSSIRAALADFSHASLPSADFSSAQARGIIMEGADLTNLRAGHGADFTDGRFARVRATRSFWQKAMLDRCDFSRAWLSEAQCPEASLREANFDRARLEVTNFDDATLCGARLSNANLLHASLQRADLSDANLDGSNLYCAGLLDAELTGATFHGSFVLQTLIAQ